MSDQQQSQQHHENEAYSTEELMRHPAKAVAYAKRLERELQEERSQRNALTDQLLRTNVKLLECDQEEEQLTTKLNAKLQALRDERRRVEAAVQAELDAKDTTNSALSRYNDAVDALQQKLAADAGAETLLQALRACGTALASQAAELRLELDRQFLQTQKMHRELEKHKEQLIVQRKVDLDDELLLERAWNAGTASGGSTPRKRSGSSCVPPAMVDGADGHVSSSSAESSPIGPCHSPRLASGSGTPSTKRRSGSVFMQKLGSTTAVPSIASSGSSSTAASPGTAPMASAFSDAALLQQGSYEPSPLQQLLLSNYVEPLPAPVSPRRMSTSSAGSSASSSSSASASPMASPRNMLVGSPGIAVPARRISNAAASPRTSGLSTSAPALSQSPLAGARDHWQPPAAV